MQMLEKYKGREQAFIKHKLLEAYLQALFMIVGQWNPRICYIDCFSGPWQEKSDDLMDTSIGISLDIMSKCRESLKAMGRDVQFRALYIEKDAGAHGKLCEFLSSNPRDGVTCTPLNGSFYDLRNNILQWCGSDDFAFFFIDPKGWKDVVEPTTLSPLLKRENSEFLINFMYDFLVRVHRQEQFKGQVKEIFGETPCTDGMSPSQIESHLLGLYRKNLKKTMAGPTKKPRFAYVSVQDRFKARTKYELVYLTRHPLGIVKFIQASEKLDLIQKQVRQLTRIGDTGQGELFNVSEHSIGDESVALEEVKSYWLGKLSSSPEYFGSESLADMHEETGWLEKDFQEALRELLTEGKVENLDIKKTRRTKFVKFEENSGLGERLREIIE